MHRGAAKLVAGLVDCKYEKRLVVLGLTTLETRRSRGNLIEVFKIFEGFDNINSDIFFDRSYSQGEMN